MPIDSVIHTNQLSIDRVLKAGVPVVLVFWEQHRPIAKAVEDQLDRLAKQYAGKALIAKVDVREETELLRRFGVSQPPAIVYTRNGEPIERVPQPNDPAAVQAWLEYLTAGGPRPATSAPTNTATHTNGVRATGPSPAGATGSPVTLTDANFAQMVSGSKPVLVDFWAEWCGPCRMVAPSVEQLAREYAGRAVVGKLNVDENPQTAGRYNIMSIPSLLIFKNGAVVDQIVGAQPLDALRQRLARHA